MYAAGRGSVGILARKTFHTSRFRSSRSGRPTDSQRGPHLVTDQLDTGPERTPTPLKSPKLDNSRLADNLIDKGLIDRETVQQLMQQCQTSGRVLAEVLVREELVSDWELARICSELFHLPYLPVETYPPSDNAREGLDPNYLRQYGLVPLDRFGNLLSVSMPGIVPSNILDGLCAENGVRILPVVGSVTGNRQWLNENLPGDDALLEAFGAALPKDEASWANLFDEGDEAVQLGLHGTDEAPASADSEVDLDLDFDLG